MKLILRVLGVLLFLTVCLVAVAGISLFQSARQENYASTSAAYTVTIPSDNLRIARVTAEMQVENGIFYMSHEGVDPSLWKNYVHNLQFSNARGETLQSQQCSIWELFTCSVQYLHCRLDNITGCIGFRPGVPRWKVPVDRGETIVMTYDVHLEHDSADFPGGMDSAPFKTDWGLFYVGRALFIANGVAGRSKDISVSFNLPDNWQVTSPWVGLSGDHLSFKVNDTLDLQESMLFAGTHTDFSVQVGNQDVGFALGGEEVINHGSDFARLMNDSLHYYASVMGGEPVDRNKSAFARIAVIINSGPVTDGEAIGRNFNMLVKQGDVEKEWINVVNLYLHELMHLWNGKTIRTSVNQGWEEEWFKEGITEYYALKSLARSGLLNRQGLLEHMKKELHEAYRSDPGKETLSLQTAAKNKSDHWGLIYGGGCFVGLALDVLIRESSNNKNSLDSLMAALYEKYAGQSSGYKTSDIQALAEELSGQDMSSFFNQHVYNVGNLPLAQLAGAGIDAVEVNGELKIKILDNANARQMLIFSDIFGI